MSAGSGPGEVSVTCLGQASTQSEGEFGVRDPHLCPSSHTWGAMLKFGFPSPRSQTSSGQEPSCSRGCQCGAHRLWSLLLAFYWPLRAQRPRATIQIQRDYIEHGISFV